MYLAETLVGCFENYKILQRIEESGRMAKTMAVFDFMAVKSLSDEYEETGTIIAADKEQATRALNSDHFDKVKLVRIRGLGALLRRLSSSTLRY